MSKLGSLDSETTVPCAPYQRQEVILDPNRLETELSLKFFSDTAEPLLLHPIEAIAPYRERFRELRMNCSVSALSEWQYKLNIAFTGILIQKLVKQML
jgi:hypothetical protein